MSESDESSPASGDATVAIGAEKWVDSAIDSARSLRQNSTTQFRSFQDFIPHALTQYKTYENAFFTKLTNELIVAKENPAAAAGFGLAAALLLMRGPRRFFIRNTLGRFQSEEAHFLRADKHIQELNMSVDLMKKESKKLLERATLADKDMNRGLSQLMDSGKNIHRLAKSVYKVECQATDLMDGLRQLPGREAIKLRAEVASITPLLRQKRIALNKRIMRMSELGVPI